MLVPFTIRFEILKYYRQFELPDTEEFNVLKQWHEDMIQVSLHHLPLNFIRSNKNNPKKTVF